MIFSIVLWALAVAAVGLWLARTRSIGALTARSRAVMIRSGIDAVVALALVRALAPPPGWASWLWVLITAAVGLGLALAVPRWSDLPWRAPDAEPRASRRAIAGTAVYAAVGTALLVVLA